MNLESIGAELVISSFLMMVKDGMMLNPIEHKYIWLYWNATYFANELSGSEDCGRFANTRSWKSMLLLMIWVS